MSNGDKHGEGKTPRTDALIDDIDRSGSQLGRDREAGKLATLARQLERELDRREKQLIAVQQDLIERNNELLLARSSAVPSLAAPSRAAILEEAAIAAEKGLTPTGQHIADCERDAKRYRWLRGGKINEGVKIRGVELTRMQANAIYWCPRCFCNRTIGRPDERAKK